MHEIKTRGEKAFQIFAFIFLTLLTIFALAPFVLIISASLTEENTLAVGGYQFWPKVFSGAAYQYLFTKAGTILNAYGISIIVTVVGTAISLIISPMIAYPMSRKDFRFRNFLAFFVFFTMIFSGGLVPSYMMWTRIFHIKDTIFSLIIPNYLMGAFNIFLLRNYFTNSIPASLIESAQLDGAKELTIFFKIILPLSTPVLATVGLFVGLAYWNDWTNGLYYITDTSLYSIQNLLNRLMQNIEYLKSGSAIANIAGNVDTSSMPSTSIRMAIAVVAVLPIIIIFPFIQKYFIKGVVVGAVKG